MEKENTEENKTESKEQPKEQAQQKTVVMSSAALLKREASTQQEDIPKMVNDAKFQKLYITPERACYVKSGISKLGLKLAKFIDLPEFARKIIEAYNKQDKSYSLSYKGRNYNVEVTETITGEQFCVQKIPSAIPELEKLGFTVSVNKILKSLTNKSGLILVAGSSSAGKTTTSASLLKKYLQLEGGYAITIEDPVELPLDGVYKTIRGDLGVCKQTTPSSGIILDGIKNAFRAKPNYILIDEITTPDVAEQILKAATSGYLVIASIKANGINDALKILAKYITSSSVGEDMGYDLLSNGLLACIYQELVGTPKHLRTECLFANPDINAGCQVRGMLRSGNINATTQLEQQKRRIDQGQPLF